MSMGNCHQDVAVPEIVCHGCCGDSPRFCVANPAPLGLCGFALTTFVHSCYNAGIFGTSGTTSPPNVVTGLSVFSGGLVGLLAGMWEFETGNTFAATTFSSYGAYRLSYAATLIPWFGVYEAYEGHEEDLLAANAVLLLGWTVFTFMMWVVTLTIRANVALRTVFAFLTITFALLTISEFMAGSPAAQLLKRAGGFFGVFTAIIAWYMALAGILTPENSYFILPVGNLRDHQP
ncbi:hypothetical protein KC19_2G282000 [Ceratodon purpureus]|uniref:Uncharacterized protein n=1 Tax=Ceratodon purpureus TaxID=3225 RepID=A0A8T0J2P2_CERPU|nr:hypothetical protein KC19_2G282000 [Ceratodon purpureus]